MEGPSAGGSDDLLYAWPSFDCLRETLIVDTTLRDGLQCPDVRQPTLDEKLELLRLITAVGVDVVDIGQPAASEQHKDECVKLARYVRSENLPLRLTCLARVVPGDVQAVLDVVAKSDIQIDPIIFIGTSDLRRVIEAWEIEDIRSWIETAVSMASKAGLNVIFGAEDGSRTHPSSLEAYLNAALGAGAQALCLADTTGSSTPASVPRLLAFLRAIVGADFPIDWHGHNDRGLAVATALAASQHGARAIHATALGVGERAGNVPIEPLVLNLAMEGRARLDLQAIRPYAEFASRILDQPISPSYPAIGSNVHTTPSGIHAAAMLKARHLRREDWVGTIYSGIDPRHFGAKPDVLVGPFSGSSNVEWRLAALGVLASEGLVKHILSEAKSKNKQLTDEDISALSASYARREDRRTGNTVDS